MNYIDVYRHGDMHIDAAIEACDWNALSPDPSLDEISSKLTPDQQKRIDICCTYHSEVNRFQPHYVEQNCRVQAQKPKP